MDGIKRFNLLNDNVYWELLKDANQHYLNIGQKYLLLFQTCKENGVAFKDIRSFLMNEAKRAGVYQKNYLDSNGNKVYKPKKVLKRERPAWYHQLVLFSNWVSRNYVSYETRVADKPKASTESKEKGEETKKSVAVRTTKDEQGNILEVTTEVTQNGTITSPVTSELTPEQVVSILTHNWELLATYCKEKGAEQEFKALMLKIGVSL